MFLSGRRIFLLAVGGYVAYLFYVPVPSDINEPQKYRAVVAFQKFLLNMVSTDIESYHIEYSIMWLTTVCAV